MTLKDDQTPTPTQTADDQFSAAFDLHAAEAAGTDEAKTSQAKPADTSVDTSKATQQQPVEDAKPAEGAASGEGTTSAEGQADDGKAAGGASDQEASGAQPGDQSASKGGEQATQGKDAGTQAGPDADLLERFAKIVTEASKQPEPKQPEPKQPVQEEPIYSKDEQGIVDQYLTDYPDVAKGEALVRRAEYQQLVSHVFSQVAAVLKPMQEMLQGVAVTTHLKDLQAAIPDYDDVRDKVVDWVDKQPKYLQDAYRRVITEGTQDEIVDLVARYRRETGSEAAAKTTTPAPKKDAALPDAARKAVAGLAPVSTKRSPGAGVAGPDPNDFDAAFDTFASKFEG